MTDHVPSAMSYSRAAKFQQCPKSYYFRYIAKLDDPPGEAAMRGSFAHEVLELLFQQQDRTPEAAKTIAAELWAEHPTYSEASPNLATQLKQKVWAHINALFTLEDNDYRHGTEFATEMDLKANPGTVDIRAIIDRVDLDNQILAEYKTGKPWRTHKEQLDLYAAVYNDFKPKHIRTEVIYLGAKPKKVGYESTPADQGKAVHKILDTFEEIISLDAGDPQAWQPNKTKLCDWCNFKPECPLWGNQPSKDPFQMIKQIFPESKQIDAQTGDEIIDKPPKHVVKQRIADMKQQISLLDDDKVFETVQNPTKNWKYK